jgi:Phage integrase, N-terminal SAM-like domain
MTPLRQRMLEDMQLRGLSPKTQRCYVFAVQQFAQHYGKSPALITEEEVRQYFLYLSTVKRVSPATVTIALCAIKFLFERTLQRPWPVFDRIRPSQLRKLTAAHHLSGSYGGLPERTCNLASMIPTRELARDVLYSPYAGKAFYCCIS